MNRHAAVVDVSSVRFAYVVIGSIVLVSSLLFFVAHIRVGRQRRQVRRRHTDTGTPRENGNRCSTSGRAVVGEEELLATAAADGRKDVDEDDETVAEENGETGEKKEEKFDLI